MAAVPLDFLLVTALTECSGAPMPQFVMSALCAVSMMLFVETERMEFADFSVETLASAPAMRVSFKDSARQPIHIDSSAMQAMRVSSSLRNVKLCAKL